MDDKLEQIKATWAEERYIDISDQEDVDWLIEAVEQLQKNIDALWVVRHNEGMEKAAKICDAHGKDVDDGVTDRRMLLENAAEAIRALKEPTDE